MREGNDFSLFNTGGGGEGVTQSLVPDPFKIRIGVTPSQARIKVSPTDVRGVPPPTWSG